MRSQQRLLPGSLRFRLTAWYTLLLAGVLAILGLSVLRLTEDQLRGDVDYRVEKTAADTSSTAQRNLKNQVAAGEWPDINGLKPLLGSFASRGLLIQICDDDNDVVAHSESAPNWALLSSAITPLKKRQVSPQTIVVDGADVRAVQLPITLNRNNETGDGQIVGSVIVGERLAPLYETIDALRKILLITSIGGLILAVLGGWLLADRALRPVDRVTAAAASIATSDGTASSLTTRLRVPDTGDELARLSATFNAMLDRLEAAFMAQQRFIADASHELRTPLTAIRGNVEVLARQIAAQPNHDAFQNDASAAIADVQRESSRMGRLLDDLLLLARSDAPEGVPFHPRPVRLDTIARDAVRSAAALAHGQRLTVTAPSPITVAGEADRLLQLLLILLENALRHTPPGGNVSVAVTAATDGTARLIVSDQGEGIAPEHLPHVFDRFYRADGARGRSTGGTGLGLAIARTIVRSHGGEIAIASAPGGGSAFTIALPLSATAPASLPRPRLAIAPEAD